MSDEIIKKMARGMYEPNHPDWPWSKVGPSTQELYIDQAKAALDAINSSGTHVVVPVEPTETILDAAIADYGGCLYASEDVVRADERGGWKALIEAARKEGE